MDTLRRVRTSLVTIAAMLARQRIMHEMTEQMHGRVLVAMPTVAHTAPSIADLEADDDLFARINLKIGRAHV